MRKTTLGRTGLEATVLGLGCGGYSKLGRALEKSDDHARAVIRRALELGVSLIDTASSYGTEPHVGEVVEEWGAIA